MLFGLLLTACGAGNDDELLPRVVAEGDSLTAGFGDRLCEALDGLARCDNSGVPGARTNDMLASAPDDVDRHLGQRCEGLLILWAGTNDLWHQLHGGDAHQNAAQAAANIDAYIDDRRRAGWGHIVVVTLPEMGAGIAGVDSLNERLGELDADEFIDLANDPELRPGSNSGYRDPDGVHFSQRGSSYIVENYYLPLIRRYIEGL